MSTPTGVAATGGSQGAEGVTGAAKKTETVSISNSPVRAVPDKARAALGLSFSVVRCWGTNKFGWKHLDF